MAKEHCLIRDKDWSTLRLDIMQQIVSINVLGITGHINFNVKILETFAMEIIMKYSKEIKTGKILHATRLNIGCVGEMHAWELSVHWLIQVWFVHAYSFFLNGPRCHKQISKR